MESFWRATGRLLSGRPWLVLIAVGLATVLLGAGLSGLDFETGQDSYLADDSDIAKDNERYQELFGGELMIDLMTVDEGKTVADLFTPANLQTFDELADDLRASSELVSVITPKTVLQWSQDLVTSGVAARVVTETAARETDPAKVALREQDAALTAARLGAAGEQTLDNPEWLRFLLYENEGFELGPDNEVTAPPDDQLVLRKALRSFVPNNRQALLSAVVIGNASLDQLAAADEFFADTVSTRSLENASFVVTGTPTFLTEINDYLQKGMLTLGAIAVGVMVVILLLAFRVRWRLLPLLAMLIGIVWGFGAFALTGTDLSLVTISGLPILIGLGIEFAIQIHARVEEECAIDHEASPFAETAARLGPPLVVATVAAVLAFLAMRISKVPMIQDFGVLLSIGIVAMLVTGVVIPFAVLGAREQRSPTTTARPPGAIEWFVRWLGSLPHGFVVPLIAVAIAVPIIGILLEDDVKIESDPINWADQSSETIENARRLEDETGFATTLGLYIQTDGTERDGIFTDQMGGFVHDLVVRATEENPELVEGSSLATTVSLLSAVPGTTFFPPTGADMLAAYELAPPDIQQLLVAEDGNATQVAFQVGPSSLEQRAEVVDRLSTTIARPDDDAKLPGNASATPAGLAVVGVGLLENLTANRAALTLLALALVAAWLVIRHGDLARAVLTMIPVLLAVGTAATLVALLGITLSPLTTVTGPLVVATCSEFCVLLVARYAEERQRGLSPHESTAVASKRTGRAFFTSALTTLGGFAVLMFSSLPLIRDFGAVVTLHIGIALLSALVVMPPLVEFADARNLLPTINPAGTPNPAIRWVAAGAGAVALLGLGWFLVDGASNGEAEAALVPETVPADEVPATLPPPTTASATPDTAVAPGQTLPPGPAERPSGLIGGTLYDGLTAAGVDAGVARCAADNLLAKKSEAELLAMGIANTPRPAEVDALLALASTECGVTPEQQAAAATAAG